MTQDKFVTFVTLSGIKKSFVKLNLRRVFPNFSKQLSSSTKSIGIQVNLEDENSTIHKSPSKIKKDFIKKNAKLENKSSMSSHKVGGNNFVLTMEFSMFFR